LGERIGTQSRKVREILGKTGKHWQFSDGLSYTQAMRSLLLMSILLAGAVLGQAQSTTSTALFDSRLSYAQLLKGIEKKRADLASRYQTRSSKLQRNEVLVEASEFFRRALIEQVFPRWYKTKWDFNGISSVPGRGEIACGYFVSTTLRDAGLVLNRYRLAQLYSHDIVKRLASDVSNYQSIAEVLSVIRQSPEDLYVVGLDQHVGFLHRQGDEIFFVHSSYGDPQEVLSEKVETSAVFKQSKLYVLGRLGGSKGLVEKWLLQTKIR